MILSKPLFRPVLFFLLISIVISCTKEGSVIEDPPEDTCQSDLCDPESIAALGLDPFYNKILDAGGIAVISSELVEDEALLVAREVILAMLFKRPDVRDAMIRNKARVGIMDCSMI